MMLQMKPGMGRNALWLQISLNLIQVEKSESRGVPIVNSQNKSKEENQDSEVRIASQHIVSEIVISYMTGEDCVNGPPYNEAIPEEHNSFGNSQKRGHKEHPVSPQAWNSEGNEGQETHTIIKSNSVKLVPESEVLFAGEKFLHEKFGIGSQFIDSKMAVTSSSNDNHKLATYLSFGVIFLQFMKETPKRHVK